MNYVIRSVRADEWALARELRLLALRDPVAHLAFLETYEEALAKPDSLWKERTAGVAEGADAAQQLVAIAPGGEWVGTVTVLVEEAGTEDWAGFPVERRQGHVVGVFVRPDARGIGLTEVLFDAALEWAWGREVERVRLIVHEENGRAQAFYRRVGFRPTGVIVPLPADPDVRELEFVLEPARGQGPSEVV
ncbi:GNAT family N-acetyltransferase [Streptomyces sp. NPDC101166]|uniref:GNAT family N-acetyltransferase n=1 Tax=Streptomyces sp. NPDC101166 TaxID=3366120 RepID=UPI0038049E46